MALSWDAGAGLVAVALGVAWMIAPERMSKLQVTVVYFGAAEDPGDHSDREKLIGRLSGALLAVLGAALAMGVIP